MKKLTVLLGAAALATFTVGDVQAAKPKKAKVPLVRPAVAPDADAKGEVNLRSHKPGQDRFSVKVKQVDNLLTYEAFMEDAVGAGTFTSIGLLTASLDEPDAASLKFYQKAGPLPLGVTLVSDLAGRQVQIQSTAQVYLHAVVPPFPIKADRKGGAWKKGKDCLTRPATPPDDNASGVIEVRSKKLDNRDRFDVKVMHVPTGTVTFNVFVDDGLGVMTNVGAMTPSLSEAEAARFRIDTNSGTPLPFGVFDVEELAGRTVEVRGSDTFVYLVGVVPAFATGKKHSKAKAQLSGVGGTGELRLSSHSNAPYEKFDLLVKTQVLSGTVDLFMADPVSSIMTLVSQLTTDAEGNAKYKVNTKTGAPLPFDAMSLADLAGLAVEIRDSGTSAVLMQGVVPGL